MTIALLLHAIQLLLSLCLPFLGDVGVVDGTIRSSSLGHDRLHIRLHVDRSDGGAHAFNPPATWLGFLLVF